MPTDPIASVAALDVIDNANDLVSRLASIADVVIYLLTALAVIYIVYSVVMFMVKGKEGDENRHEAVMQIIWGIVGLAVILSIWGLVNILIHTFGTSNNVPRDKFPSANFVSGTNNTVGNTTYDEDFGD